MDVKRLLVFGMLGLFMVSMMGGVLGADLSDEAGEIGETVVTSIGGFLEPFLSPFFGEKEMLTRVFFAILLGMIIYSIISMMFSGSSPWIKWGITGAIVSLALVGLSNEFLEVIRVQYSAMGATILTVIPFMIMMAFTIKVNNLVVARLTWIFYAMYYLAMYGYRVVESSSFSAGLPYGIAFIVGLVVFFGIKQIREMITKGEIAGITEKGMKKVDKRKALQDIQDADLGRYEE
jgi:hypothetical protein